MPLLIDVLNVAKQLNTKDIKLLIKELTGVIDDNDYKEELEGYQSINKVAKTMEHFDKSSDSFDYLTDFDCSFVTEEIRCSASYNGETCMFSPSVSFNSCFEIPCDDKYIYQQLLDDDIKNIDEYITDMKEYTRLCKVFKYKRITLAKKVIEIVNSMQNVF